MTIAEQLQLEVEVRIAKNLLKTNLTIDEISEATNLPKEKIEEIKAKSSH